MCDLTLDGSTASKRQLCMNEVQVYRKRRRNTGTMDCPKQTIVSFITIVLLHFLRLLAPMNLAAQVTMSLVFAYPLKNNNFSRIRDQIQGQPVPVLVRAIQQHSSTRSETTDTSTAKSTPSQQIVSSTVLYPPPKQQHERIDPISSSVSSSSSAVRPPAPRKFSYESDVERQISSAGRQGRTDDAIQLFHSICQHQQLANIQQQQPTLRQLNAVIDACARARPVRLTTAFDFLNSYTTAKIYPPTNGTTKTQLLLSKQPSSIPAANTASCIRKLEPNVYTFGALMNAISRLGEIDLALQVLKYMKQSNSKVRPNVVVYQSAITASANAARPDISLQLLEDAKINNVAITVIGYNAAITAASRSSNYTLAIDILRRMEQSSIGNSRLPRPDIVTYGSVMAACERCNEWQLVLQFAEEIQNSTSDNLYLDGVAITSALKACQQLGYASLAIHYLDQMKLLINATSFSPNETRGSSWTTATTTSGRERVGSKQPLQGPDAVAYRLAISACARGGAWRDGIRLLDEYCMTVNDKDVIAFTAAITGCEYAGQWIEAVQLLVRMQQVAKIQPNVVTFAAVIGACATACARMNDTMIESNTRKNRKETTGSSEMPLPLKKALQILNIMTNDPNIVDPNIQVYNAAIRTCAEAMDINRAFQLYQAIQENVTLRPNIVTYGSLMLACERVGSIKGMDQVFAMMRMDQISPNEIIYGTAISCCRKAGDKERTFSLLNKMLLDGYQPNVATINTVLISQTEISSSGGTTSNADLDRAIQIFKQFFLEPSSSASASVVSTTNTLPSRQSYCRMIRAFASNQRPKDAEALLQRMRVVDQMIPDVELYTITVSAYERMGQPLSALRLMESMREDGYDFYDVEVLNTIFKRLVKLVNAVGQTLGKGTDKSNSSTSII
jgi:pentatricopeptide repeat domain-containing protein 1